MLMNELQVQFRNLADSDTMVEKDEDGEYDEDTQFHQEHRNQVKKFFKFFVENLIVFDPLDRKIIQQDEEGEDEEINVKSADLR